MDEQSLRVVKDQLKGVTGLWLKEYLNERSKQELTFLVIAPNSINAIFDREHSIGRMQVFNSLMGEIEAHVNRALSEATEK